MFGKISRLAFLCLLIALTTACNGYLTDTYALRPAFLRVSPVTAAQPLFVALRNPGQWCRITYDEKQYVFQNNGQQTANLPRTARDAYGRPISIAGFIVGTPSLPDIYGNAVTMVFDLVCPNCFNEALIERKLTIDSHEFAECSRCARRYNLQNGGIVQTGEKGVPLFPYKHRYSPDADVFIVNN